MHGPVVVTGVSSGIGKGTAPVLLARGCRVFGSVRRPEDARRLSAELGAGLTPLLFDVTDADAVKRAAEETRAALKGERLAGLVNNAGIAVPGPLLEMPVSELRRQLEVNLVSILTVTQAFFPLLRKSSDGPGAPARIVNISSIARTFALPFLGPYAASKHGVEGLSESLRRECMLYGVDVITLDPGSVASTIWDKADAIDLSPYAKSPYRGAMMKFRQGIVSSGRRGSPPERVGAVVLRALTDRNPKVRYVIGQGNPLLWISQRLPKRLVDRMIGKNLGLLPLQ